MDILLFSTMFAVLGFSGGLLVGRWANKQDRIARRQKPVAMPTGEAKDENGVFAVKIITQAGRNSKSELESAFRHLNSNIIRSI